MLAALEYVGRPMSRAVAVMAVLTLAPPMPVAAQTGFDEEWWSLVERAERARLAGDISQLMQARADCRRLLQSDRTGAQQQQARYLLAYVNWRAMAYADDIDRDDLGEEATELLEANVEADDTDIESQALLGIAYAMRITSAFSGMRYGRRATGALDRAQQLDNTNPRLLLLRGIEIFNKPGFAGGGIDRAEPWFRSAIGYFEAEPADAAWPNWGRADAHAWLGRVFREQENSAAAREQFEQALDAAPTYRWVREVLLAGLE